MKEKIIIAGGSGFLGRTLAAWFAPQGHEVVILTRYPSPTCPHGREVGWDGRTLGPWTSELANATTLINLAGVSVDCRYTTKNRQLIMDSRIHSTRILGVALAHSPTPPRVWLNASTATIYKHTYDRPMDENGEIAATPEAKDAFSIEVATAWENEFNAAKTPHTRKVTLRTAMVLGDGPNSVFPVMRRMIRLGLGGQMSHGRQYMSWIHEVDFCRAIEWLIAHENFRGIVNLAAPNPLPNTEMMRLFREVCGAPFGLPATAWMLELGAFFLRTETELIIKSRRVVPGRLLREGFEFKFKDVRIALEDLERTVKDKT
jgi:uncharacterized protein (TIGR01777 family)